MILDVFTEHPVWGEWSATGIAATRDQGSAVIKPIIFAEVSPRFELLEELDASLPELDFRREPHFPTVEIIAPE